MSPSLKDRWVVLESTSQNEFINIRRHLKAQTGVYQLVVNRGRFGNISATNVKTNSAKLTKTIG